MASKDNAYTIGCAISILKIFWQLAAPGKTINWTELEDELSAAGLPTDRRFVSSVVDGARAAGLPVSRPSNENRKIGYGFTELPFEEWEVGFLADAVRISLSLSRKEKATLERKIGKLLPERCAPHVMRDIVTAPETDLYSGSLSDNLTILANAIALKRKITCEYWEVGPTGAPELRVSTTGVPLEPYVFVYRDDAYYLVVGKVVDDALVDRTLRVDRMSNITILDDVQEWSLFDLAIDVKSMAASSFGMFSYTNTTETKLRFHAKFAKHVAEKFSDAEFTQVDDTWVSTVVQAPMTPPFFSWVDQFEGLVRIEGGEEAKRLYREHVEKIARSAGLIDQ